MKEHEYVDLGLPSGTLWAKENIKDSEGNELYFAWGEVQGCASEEVEDKDFSWSGYKYANYNYNELTKYCPSNYSRYWDGEGDPDDLTVLLLEDDAAHKRLGGDWRVPTKKDFEELAANTNVSWTSDYEGTGVAGIVLTSKNNGNTLFFPANGCATYGRVYDVGDNGNYWSSSLDVGNPNYAWCFYFKDGGSHIDNNYRFCGFSVRPVLPYNC